MGEHRHAEGVGQLADAAADGAEADDADGQAGQLDGRFFPEAPLSALLPHAFLDAAAVFAGMAAEFQQQGDGMLGDVVHAVGDDVADGDVAFGEGGCVDDVVSRGERAHKAGVGNIFQGGFSQGNLVEEQHIGSGRMASEFRGAGRVMNDGFAEGGNGRPVHIAGIEYLAVQNGYLHEANSC